MKLLSTSIDQVHVVQTEPFGDHRGQFARFFCEIDLGSVIQRRVIRQINHSLTNAVGAIRGMHFQLPPHAEMKLVRCLRGRVFDVAVDLRANSPTFLKWHAEELSPENRHMIVIPEGFAHGFQVLEPESELLYLHTAVYDKPSERGIRFDDPMLAIDWPLPVTDVSMRDTQHPLIDDRFEGITLTSS